MNKHRRSQRNKIKSILDEKLSLEDKVTIWEIDLQQLNRNLHRIKTSEYSNDAKGQGESLEDRYTSQISSKEEIEEKIQMANDKIVRIEAALERLKIRDKESYAMFEMCYFEGKSIGYISDTKGYSCGSVLNKIRDMEDAFVKILSC